jgi:hypothetical protein
MTENNEKIELMVDSKKCGLCNNYTLGFCNILEIEVAPSDLYPCPAFKKVDSAIDLNRLEDEYKKKEEEVPLYKIDFTQFDIKPPLITRFLIFLKKHRLNPLILNIIFGTILAGLNYYFFTLDPSNGRPYSFGIFSANFALLITPYLVYYWFIERIFRWLNILRHKISMTDFDKLVLSKIQKIFSRRYLVISLLIVGIFVYWINSPSEGFHIGLYYFTYTICWLIDGFITGFAMYAVFVLLAIMMQIPKMKLYIRILHQDHFGGQKYMGDFALQISFFIALGAFAIPMLIEFVLQQNLPIQFKTLTFLAIFLYPAVMVIFFMTPTIALNKVVCKERDRLLDDASMKYRYALNKFTFSPEHEALGIRVFVTQSIFNSIENINIWPWKADVLMKLALSAFTPILLAIIKFYLPNFGNLL